jgi:hypothetical protein
VVHKGGEAVGGQDGAVVGAGIGRVGGGRLDKFVKGVGERGGLEDGVTGFY